MWGDHRLPQSGNELSSVIVGMGEIGTSLFNVLSPHYRLWGQDLKSEKSNFSGALGRVDVLHVCIRHDDKFSETVRAYYEKWKPEFVVVHSTVPVGTTSGLGIVNAVHSPNRGLHPNLTDAMKTFVKHIGGPKAEVIAHYFEKAGMKTRCHSRSETTELAHILNTTTYGVYVMFAEECYQTCRKFGLDFYEVVTEYTQTYNEGYEKFGHKSMLRPILTPLRGSKVGGHCVVPNAGLIPPKLRGPLTEMVAKYNG